MAEIPGKDLDPKMVSDQPGEGGSHTPARAPGGEVLPTERPDSELHGAADRKEREDSQRGYGWETTEVANRREEPVEAADVGSDT